MSDLITEEINETHIMHPEEHILHSGVVGAVKAAYILNNVVNGNADVTTKYDGSPSLMFGRHPETGKFFVSTKSFFNKNPKINYTHKDIKENHGDTPGLVKVLGTALDLLSKGDYNKIYRGDVMHHGDVKVKRGNIILQPNVVKYSIPESSEEGNKLKNSKLSIAVHTQYHSDGNKLVSSSVDELPNAPEGVYFIPTKANSKIADDSLIQSRRETLSSKIKNSYGKLHDLSSHTPLMKMFINHCYKNDISPFAESYMNYLDDRKKYEMNKFKSPNKKDEVDQKFNYLQSYVKLNRDRFNDLFDLHRLTTMYKDSIIHQINNNNNITKDATINNEPGHEGYVVRHMGIHKLVKRDQFSKMNFAARDKNGQ